MSNADKEFRGCLDVRVDSVFGKDHVVRARPCLPPGHFYIPDEKTTVWIEFEGGDTRFPIWVGAWYPKGATPAEAQVDPPTHRVIHTKFGHMVEISDEAGKEKIVIRHGSNAFLAIEKDGSVIVSNKSGSNIFLNADGKEATVMSEQGHLMTMTDKSLMLVNDGGSVIELKGDTASVLAPKIVLSGTTVSAGANATDPTIMGTAFNILWSMVVAHVHPSAMGPTGPPTPPILPLQPGVHLTSSLVVK